MTEREALEALQGDDAAAAGQAAEELWRMWHDAGDPRLDALLREGIEAMEREELAVADAVFTRLIVAAPDFAEGWNKRATVRYLAGDYEASIADCKETLERNPNHFGALSGQGLCHLALRQFREAAALFRRALAVHPHLEGARGNLWMAEQEQAKWN